MYRGFRTLGPNFNASLSDLDLEIDIKNYIFFNFIYTVSARESKFTNGYLPDKRRPAASNDFG